MDAPPPLGFGNCEHCPYMPYGPQSVCYECAAETLIPAAPYYCAVCGQALDSAGSRCRNSLCSSADRAFDYNRAVAMKTGELDAAIQAHKYQGRWGWGIIFARVLLGYLDRNPVIAGADLIIPMPSHRPGNASRKGNDHAGWVVESAREQDDNGYPLRLDPPVIVKIRPTPHMAGASAVERQQYGQEIYDALVVPDRRVTSGKTIVVVDDVFTSGTTLNAVAKRLREAGAARVIGLSLARAPWR